MARLAQGWVVALSDIASGFFGVPTGPRLDERQWRRRAELVLALRAIWGCDGGEKAFGDKHIQAGVWTGYADGVEFIQLRATNQITLGMAIDHMRTPTSVKTLEDLGRHQLSKSFFMREFLYSEISQIERIPNIPTDPELALAAGTGLCERVLEPLQDRLERISVRSAYRSAAVNGIGSANGNQHGCASNEANRGRHIWDERDAEGVMGAMACVVVTTYLPYFRETRDWRALAWWIHDNIDAYSELEFFTKNDVLAFNIGWRERSPRKTIYAWAPNRVCLTKPGMLDHAGSHAAAYAAWRGDA